MKKLFSLALVLAMLLSLSVTAFAEQQITGESDSVIVTYGVDDAYIVTIPASIALSADEVSTIGISAADVVIGYGELLTVSVGSSNYDAENSKWYLVDAENPENKLEYSVKNGETAVAGGDAVLTVAAGNTGGGEVTLTTRLVDTAAFSGTYKDTITFTVSVAECEHTFDQTTGKCDCGEVATFVSTKAEMVAALEKGGAIMLTGDIELTSSIVVTKDTTIALNGCTLTLSGLYLGLEVEGGCTLTVTGDGAVACDNGVSVYSGTLNLQGGTVGSLMVESSGTANISGGEVMYLEVADATANVSGGYVGDLFFSSYDGTCIITGGTFGFNPTNLLAEGYTATETDGIWTVTAN